MHPNGLKFSPRAKIIGFVALPIVLYLCIAQWLSWKPRTLHVSRDYVGPVTFSSDGKLLVTAAYRSAKDESNIQLWDIETKRLRRAFTVRDLIWAVALSPDNEIVAGGTDGKMIRLWESHSGKLLRTLNGSGPLFFDEGQRLVGGSLKWRPSAPYVWQVTTWNTRDAKPLRSISVLLGRQEGAIAPLPVSGANIFGPIGLSYSGPVYLRPVWVISHDSRCGAIALQKTVWPGASTTINKGVLVFDPRNGKPKHTLPASNPGTIVRGLAFSPNHKTIAVAEGAFKVADTVKLWSSETGRLRLSLKEGATVQSLAFSPDGTLLAIAGYEDKTVRLRNSQTGRLLRELKGHRKSLTNLAFSPDGATLATGSEDGTIKLWRIK